MEIEPIDSGFRQALTLFNDVIFKLEYNSTLPSDLKLLKLVEARYQNPDFESELAEFICGEKNNSFPYRSSYFITRFFKDLGFDFTHNGMTRRIWVRDVLLELSLNEISLVIEKGLFNKRYFRKEAKENGTDQTENYKNAIKEFKEFFNESLAVDSAIDLSFLLDFSVNTELLFHNTISTNDNILNQLIQEAKDRFFIPEDQQIALEKLWDAFERLKTYFEGNKKDSSSKLVMLISEDFNHELMESEFKTLTKIGNDYRIRHHETNKKELNKKEHTYYLFFRMLSLIDLCLSSIDKNENIID
jgi:hypothetical protein